MDPESPISLDMLHIRTLAGEGLLALDVASFHETLPAGNPVRALKQHLHSLCGLSRFRQRLLHLGDDAVLDDDCTLRTGEVQVVLLSFCAASHAQVRALWDAARSGLASEVESLLQRPQDPDAVCPGDPTPLLVASEHGHQEVARLLLEANADKEKATPNGGTPLFIAAQTGQTEVARNFAWGQCG